MPENSSAPGKTERALAGQCRVNATHEPNSERSGIASDHLAVAESLGEALERESSDCVAVKSSLFKVEKIQPVISNQYSVISHQ